MLLSVFRLHLLLICTVCCLTNNSVAQSKKQEAEKKIVEAIRLMDQGYVDESIGLINEAITLDPQPDYQYELGYAYYLKEDYNRVISIIKPLLGKKEAKDLYFQLLGNSYDLIGNRSKAIAIYQNGLKKFPNSGKLHLELGTMYAMIEDYDKAVSYYEKGVRVEPTYPSNYYRLAQLFLSSKDKFWGLIYGEIFMNLERNSRRTEEVSKWLFDTYASAIHFPSDTSVSVNISNNVIHFSGKDFKLPYGIGIYLPLLTLAVNEERSITLASLNRIRTRFIESYFLNNHDKKYPNVLFAYNKQLIDLGFFEAYNYWILASGNGHEFQLWLNQNEEKWKAFIDWFIDNPILINHQNKFLRTLFE